jgi:hypothetical protein
VGSIKWTPTQHLVYYGAGYAVFGSFLFMFASLGVPLGIAILLCVGITFGCQVVLASYYSGNCG